MDQSSCGRFVRAVAHYSAYGRHQLPLYSSHLPSRLASTPYGEPTLVPVFRTETLLGARVRKWSRFLSRILIRAATMGSEVRYRSCDPQTRYNCPLWQAIAHMYPLVVGHACGAPLTSYNLWVVLPCFLSFGLRAVNNPCAAQRECR